MEKLVSPKKLACLFVVVSQMWAAASFGKASEALDNGVVAGLVASHMVPEYNLTIRNAKLLYQLFEKNSWYKTFVESTLYYGVMHRLAPVLFSLGGEHVGREGTWKGRLMDYLYEKILENKTASVMYFHYPKLISPWGMNVYDLGMMEHSMLQMLIRQFQSANPQSITLGSDEVKVTPLELKTQKFAVVLNEKCLSISRDPRVVAELSLNCGASPQLLADAQVEVNLDEYFPSFLTLRKKFLGLDKTLKLSFQWDPTHFRFVPIQGEISFERSGSILGLGQIPQELLEAIPADAVFHGQGWLPDPDQGLNKESLLVHLKKGPVELQTLSKIPVALVYLGMASSKPITPLTAVLLLKRGSNDQIFSDLNLLFSEKTKFEVKLRSVCKNVVVLSPYEEAIEKIQSSCEHKIPSFKQMPENVRKPLETEMISLAAFLNFGRLFSSALEFGWMLQKQTPFPAELKPPQRMLEGLPAILFYGTAKEDRILFKGAS